MKPADIKARFTREGVAKSYTIAFSVRCGSTVLCNVLASLGCGKPGEYFQYPYEENFFFREHTQPGVIEKLHALVSSQVRTGVFGSKMTHDHRAHLEGILSQHVGESCSLNDILPDHKWIFMQRRDLIAQAISLYIAQTSNQWHILPNEQSDEPRNIEYDFFSILSKVMILGANNANWEAYFSKHKIKPHKICFEDWAENVDGALQQLYEFLEFDGIVSGVELEREGGLISIAHRKSAAYGSLRSRFLDDFLRMGQTDDSNRLGPSFEKWNRFFFQSQWRI